jgi:hypothetical protein
MLWPAWSAEVIVQPKNDSDDSNFRHVILKRVMDVQFISKFLRRFWRDAEFTNAATYHMPMQPNYYNGGSITVVDLIAARLHCHCI